MDNLYNEEHIHFAYNVNLNKKLVNLTIFESVVVVISFLIEYFILSHYLKNKDII